jgi:hypothetical protein
LVAFPRLKYRVSVGFPLSGQICDVADFAANSEQEHRLSPQFVMRMSGANTCTPETTIKSWKEGESADKETVEDIKAIASVLKPAHKYALDVKLMSVPAAFDSDRKFRLDSDGFGLATLLDDILGFNPELFLRLRAEFCRFFPQFKSVRVESSPAVQRHYDNPDGVYRSTEATGKAIYFESKTGQTVRAQQASDGAILFLGLLALSHLPEPPGLLLLEEPENGVYPMRLGQIIKLLKEMVNRAEGVRFPQITLTTHSPYVLSFFEPEEVTLLSRPAGEPDAPVRARPLRDAPNIRERLGNDFYLGELWYNLSEGELFGDVPCESCH